MSATVHPPSNQQKFWPLKKFALGKTTHTNSNQQKVSSGPGDKKTKKSNNNKTTEATTKTTLVTLSRQKDTPSSTSLQHRRGEKGSGTPVNDTSSKKQDQGNVTLGSSVMTTQRPRQRVASSQNTTAHLSSKESTRQQQQTQSLSRQASLKPVKKDHSHHQHQPEDIQVTNPNVMSVPKPSLSPVTTMPIITTPSKETATDSVNNSPKPLTRSNTFSAPSPPPNPPIITTLPEMNDPVVGTMGTTLASKPRQKLMRPTSCTSLRQMALHQALYPPSPKSRHYNTLCDTSNNSNQDHHYQHHYQYPQRIIKRSSTFNYMSPPCSSYRRSSESTLEDNLVTPNNEDDYEMTGQEYPVDGDCYYDDDDQTIYSSNILLVDVNKPPPSPSPPARRVLKRPVSMICQRLPDSLYTSDPSSYRHLPYHQQHQQQQHQYLHHPNVVTVGGAGDLCISSSNGNYHQDGYYSTSNDNHPSSPPPISPGSTDSGSRNSSELHRQQYQTQTNQQPLYIFPDPSSFNKKYNKRNSLQQAHHHQAQHNHQQQQPQQQQQKPQSGASHQRHYLSMDLLKQELESERAVVHALQRQKEAYNKDITYLCQNVDKLTKDGKEWKAKYEQEKAEKQKHQDDLLTAMNKFNEATEQIKQLSNEKHLLKMELDSVNNQLIMEKSRKATPWTVPVTSTANSLIEHYRHDTLQCQDQHQQIELIQNTMVQLLQLDIFGNSPAHLLGSTNTTNGCSKDRKSNHDDKERHAGAMTHTNSVLSPTPGHQQQRKTTTRSSSSSRHSANDTNTISNDIPSSSPTASIPDKSDPPSRQHPFPDAPPRNTVSSTDLDIQLQDLVQEKELLQAEYSKIPVSGGNAICRRRREDLEAKLDEVDSKMRKIRLRIRRRHKKGHL